MPSQVLGFPVATLQGVASRVVAPEPPHTPGNHAVVAHGVGRSYTNSWLLKIKKGSYNEQHRVGPRGRVPRPRA